MRRTMLKVWAFPREGIINIYMYTCICIYIFRYVYIIYIYIYIVNGYMFKIS